MVVTPHDNGQHHWLEHRIQLAQKGHSGVFSVPSQVPQVTSKQLKKAIAKLFSRNIPTTSAPLTSTSLTPKNSFICRAPYWLSTYAIFPHKTIQHTTEKPYTLRLTTT
jgi:hypothetical protein